MMRLSLFFVRQSGARAGLSRWSFAGMLTLACVYLAPAQANVPLQSIILPQAVTRSVIIDQSTWQGMGVELEYLRSDATPEATLEQLAMLLPEFTPVWSEQQLLRAHWANAQTSFVLLLWASEQQGTEGLLSAVALRQPEGPVNTGVPVSLKALDWLPKQAAQLFSFTDSSSGLPAVISSFSVPMIASQLIAHLKSYGQRNGWLHLQADPTLARSAKRQSEDLALAPEAKRLPEDLVLVRDAKRPPGDFDLVRDAKPLNEDLTFVRDAKRLAFLVTGRLGHTTVLVFESSRDTP